MKQRDLDTGQNSLVQTVPLVSGQNEYVTNAGQFNARTIDVQGIVVILANARKRLAERSYGDASSVYQPTTTYSTWPAVFAKMSPSMIYIAPKPNQPYVAEWDTAIIAADLVNGTDTDPLPYPWTIPVPFLAAHYARLQLQQYDEAQQYKTLYKENLADIADGARGMFIPTPYAGSRSRL